MAVPSDRNTSVIIIIIIIIIMMMMMMMMMMMVMFSRNVCLESLGPRPNHGPGALKGSQFLD